MMQLKAWPGGTEHQSNAIEASRARMAQRRHAAGVALMSPEPDPRQAVLVAARAGNKHAVWRADELFGTSWRRS